MRDFLQDLRYGIRVFARNPAFTLVALLALALGIGATTAIFSVVDTVLLKPLPYSEPDRIVSVGLTGIGDNSLALGPDYIDWRARNHVFEEMAGYTWAQFTLTGAGDAVRIKCGRVTESFFRTLGVHPMLGRDFTAAEDQPAGAKVILLTYGLWQRRFGGARDILGKSVTLDGVPHSVVGVLGPGFRYPEETMEALVPLALNTAAQMTRRTMLILPVIARLKQGVGIVQARTEIGTFLEQTRKRYRFYRPEMQLSMVPLQERQVSDVRVALFALLGAVGFVLLIACANVANLLLSRSASRQREIAVRTAMGAGRARLVRQLITENTLLGLAGGLLGLLLAGIALRSIIHFAPSIPRIDDVAVDLRVLGFTLFISLTVSLLAGLAPALGATGLDLNEALKQGSRAVAGKHRSLRSLLVVAEIALSLVLLVGAGLLVQTLWRLQHVNTGLAAEHALTTEIPFSGHQYPEQVQRTVLQNLLERVSTLPGVLSAALADALPPQGRGVTMTLRVEGEPKGPRNDPSLDVAVRAVSPTYFAVLGIPLKSGRWFDNHDTNQNPDVTLVNEALVRRFFGSRNPVGQRISGVIEDEWRTIIGVVADVKNQGLVEPVQPEMYLPAEQATMTVANTLVVRGVGDPLALVAELRDQVRAIDKNIPLTFTTMTHEIEGLVSTQRFNSILLSSFAGVALLLAAIGIYGVMSYLVTQRTQEIGIRMALGARRGHVLNLVVGHAFRLTIAGVAGGVGLALGLTRYLATLLYGVHTRDAWTFCSVAFLLIAVSLLASYIPALRATRVDPMNALRCE
jgi:putative ABC transport system permease protein